MFVNTGVYTVQYVQYSVFCICSDKLRPCSSPPAQSNLSYQLKCEIKSYTVKKPCLQSLVFMLLLTCFAPVGNHAKNTDWNEHILVSPSSNPIGDIGSGYLTISTYNGNRPSTSYTETKMVQSDVWYLLTCRMVADTWFVGSKYLESNSSIRAENIFFSLILLLIFK
jgi:hypothetical protein